MGSRPSLELPPQGCTAREMGPARPRQSGRPHTGQGRWLVLWGDKRKMVKELTTSRFT